MGKESIIFRQIEDDGKACRVYTVVTNGQRASVKELARYVQERCLDFRPLERVEVRAKDTEMWLWLAYPFNWEGLSAEYLKCRIIQAVRQLLAIPDATVRPNS